MYTKISLLLCCCVLLIAQGGADAQVPDTSRLVMTEWASNGMTKDPVALSFDNQGRLYLVETARRGTVDIDLRAHKTWLLDDLASDDFASMRSFFRRNMAPELSGVNKDWLKDRNNDGVHDFRDLTTIKERIRVLEDTDGDGRADKSTLYADGFNEEFNGVAAGVMPYRGDVLFTVYPDLWRLRDTDGDGKADERYSMFRGFGVHAAFDGHDLHGLTVGPEGKIYFSCGDNGFSVETREGERLHYPNTGGVLRMNPDGSDLEVYAIGLRNVQEFDFDQYGNMFGVDNDGDLEDERERAVYIAEGSDSGWRLNWQFRSPGWSQYNGGMTYNPWTAEGMWKPQHPQQPAYITPPMQNYSVGPGGFKFNPGTALNDEYKDFFFCVQFPVQKVTAFRTTPQGAGFQMQDEHTFNAGLMVSSVNFGPDGGCYLADWIGKWSPNDEGIVYRVDDPAVQGNEIRAEVKRLINNGVGDLPVGELEELLAHADRRVRHLAQDELVKRNHGLGFIGLANRTDAPQLARIHALWGLIQQANPSQRRFLAGRLPWQDEDPQIRQQCARVAGDLKLLRSEAYLIPLLKDDAPLVRSHAAIALAKTGTNSSTKPLLELLQANDDKDFFIRHAAVYGLSGAASAEQLVKASVHQSAAVRLGAALALRRQKSPQVIEFLKDKDVRVVREAVRAIHDDFSIPDALPAVAAMLDREKLPADEPILRRVISANLRVGDLAAAYRLVNFIKDPARSDDLSNSMKREAITCLQVWKQFPLVDRVEGRIRKTKRSAPAAAGIALANHLTEILSATDGTVGGAAISCAASLDVPMDARLLRGWVATKSIAMPTRVSLLSTLAKSGDAATDLLIDEILNGNIATQGDDLWKAAYGLLVQRKPERAWAIMDTDSTMDLKQFFVSQVPAFGTEQAASAMQLMIEREATEATPLLLDVVHAARQMEIQGDAMEGLESKIKDAPYGEFQFALLGGDAKRGEFIYRNHVSAQCIRCHDAGGVGKQAGPMLNRIGGQERQYLLEALVDPGKTIAKGYEGVTIVKDNGKLVTGTVISEDDDQIVVGASNGKQTVVRKSEIDERSAATQSAMPKMSEVLSPMEIRDVVEYLSTLK